MRKSVKAIMTTGFALALASSASNCLLISDVLGVDPVGGVPVETVIRQAAASSANGWFHGCNSALKKQADDVKAAFNVGVTTDCWDGAHNGAEPFALYATAARNAANTMIPIAQEKSHAYYVESSIEPCKSAAFTNAFLLTKVYLESTVTVTTTGTSNITGPDDFALSTLIGVSGTGQACFEKLVGTGRVLSIGGANL